jgi:hypothetical protein
MPARRPWKIRVTVNLMSGDSAKEIIVFVCAHHRTRHLYDLVTKRMRPNPSEVIVRPNPSEVIVRPSPSEVIELVTQSAQRIVPFYGFVSQYLTIAEFREYHERGRQLVDRFDVALDINLTAIVRPDFMLVGEE